MTANYVNYNEQAETNGSEVLVNAEAPVMDPIMVDADVPLLEAAEPTTEEKIASTYSSTNATMNRIGEQTTRFLQDLPTYTNRFFNQYRPLLVSIGFLFLALLSLRLLSALIGTINSIPLMESLLELVGLGYVIWFTYRYLLTVENRRELSQKLNQIKARVLGGMNELS